MKRIPFVKMAKVLRYRLYNSEVPSVQRLYVILRMIFYICRMVFYMYRTGSEKFLRKVPPGRWDSPIPSYKDISARAQDLFDRQVDECSGVDLRVQSQLELLDIFSNYYSDLLFPSTARGATRYYYRNTLFSYGDAFTLYSFIRHYEPAKVIEIGGGFSSAVMLDANELLLNNKVRFTFIEPRPERLLSLLTPEDKHKNTILKRDVQNVPLEVFRDLSANDILFIDTSHIVKVGSEVGYIVFNILPELRPGVIIHFHDIYWPFENRKDWVLEQGWPWNEVYLLRAFLQFNDAFEIMYFNSFIAKRYRDVLEENMPRLLELTAAGGDPWSLDTSGGTLRTTEAYSSLWLRKVK